MFYVLFMHLYMLNVESHFQGPAAAPSQNTSPQPVMVTFYAIICSVDQQHSGAKAATIRPEPRSFRSAKVSVLSGSRIWWARPHRSTTQRIISGLWHGRTALFYPPTVPSPTMSHPSRSSNTRSEQRTSHVSAKIKDDPTGICHKK